MATAKLKTQIRQESDFEIKTSTIAGIGEGLFAVNPLNKGDTIGPYTGIVVSDEECEQEPYASSHYILWVCKDVNIVGEGELASYTRYINHSDEPNLRFVTSSRWKKARVETLRDIFPGEELFVDYGPHFWGSADFQKQS